MNAHLLLLLIVMPLIGMFFVLSAKDDRTYAASNVYNVTLWTMLPTIGLILYAFSFLDLEKKGIQLVEKYGWLYFPPADILLGVDVFALLLLLSINLAFAVAVACTDKATERPKTLLAGGLMFISLINGYLLAADIISFYIFFTALSAPLIILVSTYGSLKKKNAMVRFSLYNLTGALLLCVAVVMIYKYKAGNIPLNTVANLNFKGKIEYFVWLSIFLAFISRLPVWPFHYWISSINAGLKNPLVFVIGNLIPLIGLYGFIRFWPNTVPQTIAVYAPFFEGMCVITMLFISLISLSHKDLRYKLFAYTSVCCLLYLAGVFLPTGALKLNIGYALFSYIIIVAVLSFLISHVEAQKKRMNIYGGGILCYMPRASRCISLFVLAGIGLPITPLFWNNFIIISEMFNYNLALGISVMLSVFIIGLALLEELYRLKDKSYAAQSCALGADLPNVPFALYIGCLVVLFFSFFKPLWFVF